MRQCVPSRLRTVEYSRVSLQDAAERCVVRLAHVAPLCVASVLSYKKVSKGSEFLPGYAMQAPGLVDIKRMRRVASRVPLSGTHHDDTARTRSIERPPSPEQGQDNLETESYAGDVILAAPAPPELEPESCCARLLRLIPRSVRIKVDAYITFE